MIPFACPRCRSPLDLQTGTGCEHCGHRVTIVDGIPLLVTDPASLASAIADRSASGRESWYEQQQDRQLTGPYRHHLLKRRRWVEGVLQALPTDRRTVGLDAGCGDGVNLAWLRPHFAELYATDFHLLRARRASARGIADAVAVADLTEFSVTNASVDVVFCNHVLEHIPADAPVLAELRRALRPGGLLVLGIPNEGAAFWRLAYRLEPKYRRTTDHVHFYTADEIADRCQTAGFVVRHVEHIGWGVPSWTLDAVLRRVRAVDDALEWLGRRLAPKQATSLYVVAEAS